MATGNIGTITFGSPDTSGVTGRRKKTNPYAREAVIGAQKDYLPQLKAIKENKEQTAKSYDLEVKQLDAYIKTARDELEAISASTAAQIGSDEGIETQRNALMKEIADYEIRSKEAIAARQLATQKEQAKASQVIGYATLAASGFKAAGALGWKPFGATAAPASAGMIGATGGGTVPAAGTSGVAIGAEGVAASGSVWGGASLGAGVGFGAGAFVRSQGAEKKTAKTVGIGAGMMAGGAKGFAVGGPWGAVIGAVVGGIAGWFGGGGGGCCFIFIASHGTLDPVVRRYRDEHMTVKNRRGYCWLADRLVPLMGRSKWIKGIVGLVMVKPLTKYGKYHYGYERVGIIFRPLRDMWLAVFTLLGNRPPYKRAGTGEVV